MAPNKNPGDQPSSPDRHAVAPSPAASGSAKPEGWYINRPATFVATTALAVLTGTPHWHSPDYHSVPGDEATRSGSVVAGTLGEAGVQPAPEKEVELSAEVWARLFSSDEHAGELTGYGQLGKVRHAIVERQKAGYRITRISVEGYASDEDDSVDAQGRRTGGLREPNAHNRALAATRADEFKPMLREDLGEHNVDGVPPIVTLPPVEDMVSSAEKQHIDYLAQKFGYHEPVRLIEDYNRQRHVPPEVNEYLDEVLAQERKVVVRIDSEKVGAGSVPPQAALTPGEGGEGNATDVIDLDAPLLLFMIVPWYRRRRREEEAGAGSASPIEPADSFGTATMISATPIEAAAAPAATPIQGNALKGRILPSAVMPSKVLPSRVMRSKVMPSAVLPSRTAESAVLQSRVMRPVSAEPKDAAYRRREAQPAARGVTRPIRPARPDQPRPQNMHGHKGANRHLERSRGGDRRGKRASF